MQWELSTIYENENQFVCICTTAQREILEFYEYYKKIKKYEVPQLAECLKRYELISNEILKAQLYKSLVYYGGNEVDQIEPLLDGLLEQYNEFITPFPLSLLHHDELRTYLEDPCLTNYSRFLKNLFGEKKYLLDVDSEKIIHLKNTTGYNAMQQLYLSSLEDAEFFIKGIGRFDYNTMLGYLNVKDEKIRNNAARKLGYFFKKNNIYFTKLFNFLTQDMLIDKRIRNYDSIYESIYSENEVSETDYKLLEKLVIQNVDIFQRYCEIKAQKMNNGSKWGVSNIHDLSKRICIEDALDIIVTAFNNISSEYKNIVTTLFNDSHIDYECREGKQSGAICFAAVPDVRPYVFINYSGTISDLFTLGHELGHAVHFATSAKKNSVINYMESNLHTESVAVFFETLVCREYLKRSNNSCFAFLEVMDNFMGKIYRQTMNFMFEKRAREYEGYITPEQMEKEWEILREQFYGDTVKFWGYEKNNYWSIPHFICEPLLTSVYVFSQIIALMLVNKLEIDDFEKKFHGYLEIGSNNSFMEYLFKEFHIRIDQEKNWQLIFNELRELLKRLERANE